MSPDLSKNIDRDGISLMGVQNSLPRCQQLERGIECNLSRNDGVSNWSTGVTLAESSVMPGVLWHGSDDGNISVSEDYHSIKETSAEIDKLIEMAGNFADEFDISDEIDIDID